MEIDIVNEVAVLRHLSVGQLRQRFNDLRGQMEALQQERLDQAAVREVLSGLVPAWEAMSPNEQARVVRLLVSRVDYDDNRCKASITFQPLGLKTLVGELLGRHNNKDAGWRLRPTLRHGWPQPARSAAFHPLAGGCRHGRGRLFDGEHHAVRAWPTEARGNSGPWTPAAARCFGVEALRTPRTEPEQRHCQAFWPVAASDDIVGEDSSSV